MKKQITVEQAVEKIEDEMTIMVAGFLSNGSANSILAELSKKNIKNLTVICNDTSFPDKGVGVLFEPKMVKKVITSYVGANPFSQNQMNDGSLEVEFVPQGTLAERIRCGGCGIGGFLSLTGKGTLAAAGKQIINIDGTDYLLEKPLRADIALLGASVCDESGNLWYEGTSRNFNVVMAMAADLVIAEVDKVVPTGEILPENVHTPATLIDFIVRN
jgi:acetate CoA/acetoacetate CoA-transferase alpha subunit